MPKSMQLATLLAVPVLAGCGSSPKANFYTLVLAQQQLRSQPRIESRSAS
ncbi:MAG: hypothetical protein IPI44_23405 [Sulfuritalea sp.]|nr:hypothetical protein [Sulfuritalea sp.]